ncbi:MAG: hypothetical protein OXC81_07765 [Betaproteobacteria bacterium]|nr:hypothetical protein [Betaproteobacteria bacterium]
MNAERTNKADDRTATGDGSKLVKLTEGPMTVYCNKFGFRIKREELFTNAEAVRQIRQLQRLIPKDKNG